MLWSLPDGIDTPALVIDLDTLSANIDSMASQMLAIGVALRPHVKTHKSPQIARMQINAGGRGVTVASLGEAEVFAASGFDDIFIAYPLYPAGSKASRLRALAGGMRLSVGVDSIDAARALAGAVPAPDCLTVLIELDSGQHRSGVAPEAAVDLALRCGELGLDVGGVFTHGGHSYRPSAAAAAAADESRTLDLAVEYLAAAGVTAPTVSAGSTPTAIASAVGRVTEERPGTYVFNDRQQLALGTAKPRDVAVAVAATVVSTAVGGQAVIDAGSKALASDRPDWLSGHGAVPELGDATVAALSECHGMVRLGAQPTPAIGTVVRVVPNHICTAVNLFDYYEVVSGGQLVDRWPIAARGHLS
ncbi:MAG: alanine racemase [Acidimicrobiales bacterium]|jgi:D-serine deaminase-like pyridoxal phosphate-dependent protein